MTKKVSNAKTKYDVIEDVLDYLRIASTPKDICALEKALGIPYVRCALTKFVRWLSEQGKSKRITELRISSRLKWSSELVQVITQNERLSRLFVAEKDAIRFRAEISDLERLEIANYVYTHHKPIKHVTFRRVFPRGLER